MFSPVNPYVQSLGSGLILKSVGTLEDVERLAAFNLHIHGGEVDHTTRALLLHHPDTRPEHWLYVEDEATARIVSALCLIPWRWSYEGVELRAGEMGIVGTLEEFRHRGLIRALMGRFSELLYEGEFDLSHIQGIPYFYRQFGYEYALPLEGGWRIYPYQIGETEPDGYRFRLATPDDFPVLMRLYDEAACDLAIHAQRGAAIWRYLIERTPGTDMALDLWLVLDENDQPAGYFGIQHYGFGEGLNVSEVSRLSHTAARAVLSQLKRLAAEKQKPYIRLITPDCTGLVQRAVAMGAHDEGRYAWQIHLPDAARLLRTIGPVLERRLANSAFAGLTQTVILNLYKATFGLRFERGRLAGVESRGFTDEGEIRIPPLLLAPLVLGWRSREELHYAYPDFSVWGEARWLVDVLFPKMQGFIYTIY